MNNVKSRYFGILLIVTAVLFTGYTTYSSNQTNIRLADLSLMNIESLAGEDDDIMDGGEIDGGGIVCNTGGSGTCYKMAYQDGLYGVCYFFCIATGNPSNYCSSFYVNLVKFSTIIGGI